MLHVMEALGMLVDGIKKWRMARDVSLYVYAQVTLRTVVVGRSRPYDVAINTGDTRGNAAGEWQGVRARSL